LREGPRSEENPCGVHEVKCNDPGDKSRESEGSLLPEVENHEPNTVEEPPDDKRPPCSMPESDKKERDENIQEDLRFWNPAPQGNVDIVADEPTERDMPPAPEFLKGERLIGAVEIDGKLDIEKK
jgi:hypothetical protein